ncbi:MAG: FISUMP domain-containing protein [Lutibacter sp.]|nr:FISUMP domain-containing protein [Lutibacter sp.]
MKKLLLLLFFLLAFIKIEAQQNRGIEKSDIKRENPQTRKEIKSVEGNKPNSQRTADLKKLADELVNAFEIDDVTWSSTEEIKSNNPNNEEISSAATGNLKNIYPPGNKTKTSRFGSFDEIEYFAWEYLGENIPNAYYVVEITKIGNNGQAQQIFTGQVAANTHKNVLTGEEINRATKKVAKFKAGKALADTVKRNGNPNQGGNGEYQWTVKETTTGISSNPSFFTISDAAPCKIDIKPMGQSRKYCAGNTINLNWSGATPTGQVTISLFDNTNNTVYAVLATGIANTGSYTYIIPSSFPCDPPRSWSLIVEDAEKLCLDRSSPFIIECCNQQSDCDCGKWLTQNVSVKEYVKKIPRDPKLKKKFPIKFEKKVECGNKIELKPTMKYTFTAPKYVCNPINCAIEYKWEVVDANGIILSGTGKTFNHTFNNYGTYKVIFTPICGGKRCSPCVIYVNIDKFIQHEPDPIGIPYELPAGAIKDVYNSKTGKTWMNKNLGASQVATSPTDSLAYGDLYQWGRLMDGHEKRTSGTTTTLSSSDTPGHSNFILASSMPNDWRSPQNVNLWQGLVSTNNPCPTGYRLPTASEWDSERLSWSTNDAAGAFASPLKLPVAGIRDFSTGSLLQVGFDGVYWSSTVSGTNSRFLFFGSSNTYMSSYYHTSGHSVRCIKN